MAAFNWRLTDIEVQRIASLSNAKFEAFALEISKRIKEIADSVPEYENEKVQAK